MKTNTCLAFVMVLIMAAPNWTREPQTPPEPELTPDAAYLLSIVMTKKPSWMTVMTPCLNSADWQKPMSGCASTWQGASTMDPWASGLKLRIHAGNSKA